MFSALVMVVSRVQGLLAGMVGTLGVLSFVGISAGLGMRQYQHPRQQYVSRFPSPSAVDTEEERYVVA